MYLKFGYFTIALRHSSTWTIPSVLLKEISISTLFIASFSFIKGTLALLIIYTFVYSDFRFKINRAILLKRPDSVISVDKTVQSISAFGR